MAAGCTTTRLTARAACCVGAPGQRQSQSQGQIFRGLTRAASRSTGKSRSLLESASARGESATLAGTRLPHWARLPYTSPGRGREMASAQESTMSESAREQYLRHDHTANGAHALKSHDRCPICQREQREQRERERNGAGRPWPHDHEMDCGICWHPISRGQMCVELPTGRPAHVECSERERRERAQAALPPVEYATAGDRLFALAMAGWGTGEGVPAPAPTLPTPRPWFPAGPRDHLPLPPARMRTLADAHAALWRAEAAGRLVAQERLS